jgi:phage FluMu protein Com
MATAVAAQDPEPEGQPTVRVKIVCSHCDRVVTRHSRRGYTVRCPHCGTVNAGPALIAEQGKPKAEGAIRRRTRRTRKAEQRSEREAGLKSRSSLPAGTREEASGAPAPAPVRRKAKAAGQAASPVRNAEGPDGHVQGVAAKPSDTGDAARRDGKVSPVAARAATGKRSGFFDRLLYGEEDE